MSHIRKHFLIRFPIIEYNVLYAELNNGKKTKTYSYEGKTYTEIITLSEYLAAISYAIMIEAQNDISRMGFN
ncbi:MAG: hypothetical protein BWY70_01865 [Bacteroidetes bacterium ADurb.Bin408]|jgi:hypothetical protein|nr:MAG: hypothetical protein BWY70_01865 [Bacteroidetes bacterium ADurb.Bin408]